LHERLVDGRVRQYSSITQGRRAPYSVSDHGAGKGGGWSGQAIVGAGARNSTKRQRGDVAAAFIVVYDSVRSVLGGQRRTRYE
jgi:hypothetical protein